MCCKMLKLKSKVVCSYEPMAVFVGYDSGRIRRYTMGMNAKEMTAQSSTQPEEDLCMLGHSSSVTSISGDEVGMLMQL